MQSIYNGFPLRGGERVVLKIAGNSKVNKEGLDFSKNPRDYFYKSVFGRTYAEQMAFETAEGGGEDDGGEESYYRSRRKNRNYKR